MRSVLFVTNIPAPYRVDFFNELGKYCDLTVFFECDFSTERDNSWKSFSCNNFKGVVLKGKRTAGDSAFCPSVIREYQKRHFDDIFICDFSSPTGIVFINYLIHHHIPYYLESDGAFANKNHVLKFLLKRYLFRHAKKCFSTSPEHDKYYLAGGARPEQLIRYSFSSIFNKDVLSADDLQAKKTEVRKARNLPENELSIVSVGRFIPQKGFDLLLEGLPLFPENAHLYLIGGKPTEEYRLILSNNGCKHRVTFLDFMPHGEVLQFMTACDIFVMPTVTDIWGLVINEALAVGLPIISSSRCLSASVLVNDGKNGYIVERTPESFAQAICMLYKRDLLEMGRSSLANAKTSTIETMVSDHLTFLSQSSF